MIGRRDKANAAAYAAAMQGNTEKRMNGSALARRLADDVRANAMALKDRTGFEPTLAVVIVGDDPASHAYVRSTVKKCSQNGISTRLCELPETTTTGKLLELLSGLASDSTVHGILLQHPLPRPIDSRAAFEAIPAAKDMDGVAATTMGRVVLGLPAFAPCTPTGIMRLLHEYKVELAGADVVVIGRSPIVGKPLAALLTNADATVTLCHSRTRNLPDLVRRADIVCAAVGKPRFVSGDWIKPGAVVIDAGYHDGGVGDVDYAAALEYSRLITPVPGGVGPMTIAVLMQHTLDAATQQLAHRY